MKVKPIIPGAVIFDPETLRRLPDEGGEVPNTSFWLRRLNGVAGSAPDVELVKDEATSSAPAAAQPRVPSTQAKE